MAYFEEEEEDLLPPSLIKIKVADLIPHPTAMKIYDYRTKKDIKVLAKTMQKIGQLEPIVIDKDKKIISGHRRWKAAILNDWKELDAIIMRPPMSKFKSQEEFDEYITVSIVYHNQQRKKKPIEIINEAEAILGILGKNQGKRRDLLGDDVNAFGAVGKDRFEKAANVIGDISASTLRRIMEVVEFEKKSEANKNIGLVDQIVKGELAPMRAYRLMNIHIQEQEERKQSKSKVAKVAVVSEPFSLYNKSSDKMTEVQTGSVQVVFTSPPYFQQRNYGNSSIGKAELGLEKSVNEFIKNLSKHLKDVKRVLNDKGSFFLNIADTTQNGECLQVPNRLVLNLCDTEGWHLVNEIIWQKTSSLPKPGKKLQNSYEKIFHLVKDTSKYYYEEYKIWNETESKLVKSPGGRNLKGGKAKEDFMISKGYSKFKDFLTEQQVKDIISGPNAASRQNFLKKIDSEKEHPALMPDYLPVIPILTTSKPGDIVLDPFSGSATTGRTAILFDRKYIGYEINKANHDLAVTDLNMLLK